MRGFNYNTVELSVPNIRFAIARGSEDDVAPIRFQLLSQRDAGI